MRSAIILAFITAFSLSAFGQSAKVSTDPFQTAVTKELARRHISPNVYHQSDLVERMIDRYVAKQLGYNENENSILEVEKDTSYNMDVSRNPADENETNIAVSRTNPKLIVAGANQATMFTQSMPAYVSTDAGFSWKTYRLPIVQDADCEAVGDPMLACDDKGMFYYAFLIDGQGLVSGADYFISDLIVARSTDGKTWTMGNPVMGNTEPDLALEDKETMAVDCDPTSPHHGRLYLVWTHYGSTQVRDSIFHYLAYSDDHGDTWSTPRSFTTNYGYFAQVRVGHHGTVYIASSQYEAGNGTHGMIVSHDGGETFSEYAVADYVDYPDLNSGRNGLKGGNGFRSYPYMTFDVDGNDQLCAVYGTYDGSAGAAAQFEVVSQDDGQTWSDPVQIGSSLDNDHFMPWVTYDAFAKQTYVTLYSSEEDTVQNVKSRMVRCDYASPHSLENLGTLFDPLKVSSNGNVFIGDYIGADASGGTFAAAWTQNRVNFHDGEVFAYVGTAQQQGAGQTGAVRQINEAHLDIQGPFPNPVAGNTASLQISSNVAGAADIVLYDLRGIAVRSLNATVDPDGQNSISVDLKALPAGVYRAVVTLGSSVEEENIVVLR